MRRRVRSEKARNIRSTGVWRVAVFIRLYEYSGLGSDSQAPGMLVRVYPGNPRVSRTIAPGLRGRGTALGALPMVAWLADGVKLML
jgi:hypothetical protein